MTAGITDCPELKSQVRILEDVGRIRLSQNFFLRDFLYSEIASAFGIANIPENIELAVAAGSQLASILLEPLHATFGKVCVRSGYRSRTVNAIGHGFKLGCASNRRNYAGHIWDARDEQGRIGATATIVIPWLLDRKGDGGDWRSMAWWVHDHLPYSYMCFYPKLCAFNIQWREEPERRIMSWARPKGILTEPGRPNFSGDHAQFYKDYPPLLR